MPRMGVWVADHLGADKNTGRSTSTRDHLVTLGRCSPTSNQDGIVNLGEDDLATPLNELEIMRRLERTEVPAFIAGKKPLVPAFCMNHPYRGTRRLAPAEIAVAEWS